MTLYEFIALDETEKGTKLWDGVFKNVLAITILFCKEYCPFY
jgi:hypothetical protein